MDYERWSSARNWFAQSSLYKKPIVRHDFDDSGEFDQNAYNKGGWVLYMLRRQLGEERFHRALKHYLEVNRGKNVVTADFVKAVEESSYASVQQFFNQWVYGAGAPKYDVGYTYDDSKHQVALTVKQTQKAEGRVGIFTMPVDVEITTSAGSHLYPITVAKQAETFSLPASSAPLMVLFDKGGHILKTADVHKDKKEWLYQLKNAAELSDRADGAVALKTFKEKDEEIINALGDSALNDKAWGVRATAADSLGALGGAQAAKKVLVALDAAKEPWLRSRLVAALGNFKDDKEVLARLPVIAEQDNAYRARAAALQALGKLKSPDAFRILNAAITADSPDDFLRNAALRALGPLGDDKAVPVLSSWSAIGKPMPTREAAIASLARLQKDNKEITRQIAAYLSEPHFPVRMAALFALGGRGDATAIPALEEMLKSNDLSIEMTPMIKAQIAKLKRPAKEKPAAHAQANADDDEDDESADGDAGGEKNHSVVADRLDKLEHLLEEMNGRLKVMETRLPAKP